MPVAATDLLPGFADPVGSTQATFRAVLDAMARPGEVRTLPTPPATPEGWSAAATALALTLFDQDTAVWLGAGADNAIARAFLRFHCGAPLRDQPEAASFAVIADPGAPLDLPRFAIGDQQYPDRSATLILAVSALSGSELQRWSGPGIRDAADVALQGLPPGFAQMWAGNHALYPSGVDIIFTCGDQVIGLPRSIAIQAG